MTSNFRNILYIGTIDSEHTSRSRYQGLHKYSKRVDVLDVKPNHTFLGRIKFKLFRGKTNKLDSYFEELMESNKYSLVWSDKPTYLSPERLLKIKENFPQTTFVAHITDDVLQVKTMINEIDKVLSIFDYVFTPNKFNIAEFPEINFIYQELGYDHKLYTYSNRPIVDRPDRLSFVGHYEPAYEDILLKASKVLRKTHFEIQVAGSGWWKSTNILKTKNIKVIRRGWIPLESLKDIYNESILAFGLYSKVNRNKTSGRIFELSALGVPILTEGNPIIDKILGKNYLSNDLLEDPQLIIETLKDKNLLEELRVEAYKNLLASKSSWEDRTDETIKAIRSE